ncbi:MAG: DMT family transporter [Lachnospiraceae bacterium]|nr:DMT family transporter [Lachnospiraceae bacterium]
MKQMKNNMMLLLTALIWGCAFVAQSVGMDYVGPFTFNCVRCILGSIVLIPVIFLMDGRKRKGGLTEEQMKKDRGDTRTLVTGGVCCGVILAAASSLQQFGILFTTVGKAGFITAMYIVIVPVLGIFFGKKVKPLILLCVVIAVAGLYFLCMTEKLSLGMGDLLVLLCAAVFSVHILVIDHFSPLVDGVRMSAIQFLTAGIVCAVPMLLWERPVMGEVVTAWMPLLYAGVLSCGVAYTLQILGQKNAEPTVASLILSLESVFSVLAGWILLGQSLSGKELFGCGLMFVAIILAQLPEKKK